jgi:hypothetical protein
MPRNKQQGGRSYLKGKGPRGGGKPKKRTREEEQGRVTEPLTPKTLRKETQASTNLRFKPLEKAIAGDLRASERRVGEEGNWWQNYLNTVNAGQADTSAAYAQAAQTGQAQVAQASAIDTANTDRLQGEAAKSAALRGVAPSSAPAERETAMQGQRNYLSAAQGATTANLGANQRGYLNDQKRIGVGQSIASRKEEQRRGRSIRKDRQDVRKERGDYAATKRGELRGEERDYLINRQAFGLDKKKANQEAREGARGARESAQERAEDRRQKAIENRQRQEGIGIDRRKTRNDEKGGGKTPSERNDAKEGRQNATAKANQLVSAHGYPKSGKEWSDLEEAVAKESEVSPTEARAAVAKLKARAKRQQELEALPAGR